jgi:hypothetical protein
MLTPLAKRSISAVHKWTTSRRVSPRVARVEFRLLGEWLRSRQVRRAVRRVDHKGKMRKHMLQLVVRTINQISPKAKVTRSNRVGRATGNHPNGVETIGICKHFANHPAELGKLRNVR